MLNCYLPTPLINATALERTNIATEVYLTTEEAQPHKKKR